MNIHILNSLKQLNNKVFVGKAGGVEAVIFAMCTHASNAGVQHNGCRALLKFIFDVGSQELVAREWAAQRDALVDKLKSADEQQGHAVNQWAAEQRYGSDDAA